jgi:hypothetical protein
MWTEEVRTTLRAQIDAGVQKGKTKSEMYALLAPKYNVSVGALESAYRYDREQAARYASKARARKKSGVPLFSANTVGGVTMSADEALQFFNIIRKLNITIG